MRIAIVDDIAQERELIQQYVADYAQQHDLKCTMEQYTTGLSFLKQYEKQYDLIFMDVEMPEMDGIETARRLRQKDANVILIFVTQMAQYAVNGYEVEALDYLVKPVRYYSFEMTFRKAVSKWNRNGDEKIVINTGEKICVFQAKDIYWVEVFGHYLTYHTSQGELVVKGSIGNARDTLPGYCFFQCSRHSIINLAHVTSVEKDRLMIGQHEIDVSRSKRKEVMEAVMNMFGGVM